MEPQNITQIQQPNKSLTKADKPGHKQDINFKDILEANSKRAGSDVRIRLRATLDRPEQSLIRFGA